MERVTILIPIKNGEVHLRTCIEQIENCCGQEDEILVINDHSDDGTLDLLLRWASTDSRVRVLENKGYGLVAALNLGISQANTNWIARFDVDDLYSPERLIEQRKYIDSKVAAIFTDYLLQTSDQRMLGIIPTAVNKYATYISLLSSTRTPHPSVLFNREFALKAGGYIESDFPAEDLSLWIRLAELGDLVSVPKILLKYTVSPNSVSNLRRVEANKKKKQLINNMKLNVLKINGCLDYWREITKSYSKYENSEIRVLLFYRDLCLAIKQNGRSHLHMRNFPILTSRIILNPLSYFALMKLVKDKIIRQLYRLRIKSK